MKKIILLSLLLAFGFVGYGFAASLQFDHSDTEWEKVTGYTFYFNEAGQTDDNYTKTVLKEDLVRESETVTFVNIETKLNLSYNQDYVFSVTAYNDAGESGGSNIVNWTRGGFVPTEDNLPQATIINIPGPVIINIQN